MASNVTIADLSHDSLCLICDFLIPLDFLCVRRTCLVLYELTNEEKYSGIKKYWQKQCYQFWSLSRNRNYSTHDWFVLFQSMVNFVLHRCTLHNISKYKHILNQLQAINITDVIWCDTLQLPIQLKNITDLDSKLKLIYSLRITMESIPSILVLKNIIITDNIEMFKIYICNTSSYNSNSNSNITSISKAKEKMKTHGNYNSTGIYERSIDSILMQSIQNDAIKISKYLLGDDKFSSIINVLQACNDNKSVYKNETPLSLAVNHKSSEIVSLLLKHPGMTKEGINQRDESDRTALHNACAFGSKKLNINISEKQVDNAVKVVGVLISDERTMINAVDSRFGEAPLMVAARTHSKLVKVLLENKNIDINQQNKEGDTALHCIARSFAKNRYNSTEFNDELLKSAKLLLATNNINYNLVNKWNKTALQIAKANKFDKLVKALKNHANQDNADDQDPICVCF